MKVWKHCPDSCPHICNCKLAEDEAACDTCYFNGLENRCEAMIKVSREELVPCFFYRPSCERIIPDEHEL